MPLPIWYLVAYDSFCTLFLCYLTMFDELWSEIVDAPGEIYDVIDYKEEWEKDDNKFNLESYINSNIDY